MIRIRVLTLLTLALAVFGFHYGYYELARFDTWNMDKGSFLFVIWLLAYLALTTVSCLSFVSSVMIFLLSFFAIQPDNDGVFVINRDSLYGRIFLAVAGIKGHDEYSYCRIFWQINGILYIWSLAAAFGIGTLVIMWKTVDWNVLKTGLWWIGVGITGIIGVMFSIHVFVEWLWRPYLFGKFGSFSQTQFGYMYNKYLCPRLKVR